ncbi:tyrosine-type recombinase/integrase [Gracilimonas sp.]|uniref:tyrosine-type recombinase/integrase n=1 Tax=Gracilimonas sp. TaxID=1974203 RepID=UPI002871EC52|nr:tyrosine-type recombinase/integrase [Gracilimonas sp.]
MEKNLTDAYVKTVASPKRIEIFDTSKSGLALRVNPSGYKSFFYRYRFGGKIKRFTIGGYPSVSLAEARRRADELRVQVHAGEDPQGEKQRLKNKEAPKTIGELADLFEEEYIERELKESTQSSYKSRLNKIRKKFSKYSVDEVTRGDVKRFLKKIADKQPYNANRVQAIFSKMYSFAFEEEYTDNHPLKRLSKFGEEETRDTNYYPEDIRNLWQAMEEEREPTQSLIKLLLITGQRLGETSRMKWADIDTENALWIIPKKETKGDRVHVVPLSDKAIEVLERLHELTGEKDYVFNSPKKDGQPLSYFRQVMDRIEKRAELEDFRLHDLRHIVATNMQRLKIDFMHIGKVLNHKGMAKEYIVTSRYIDYDYLDEKRDALQKWSNELDRIISGKKANIFKIGG